MLVIFFLFFAVLIMALLIFYIFISTVRSKVEIARKIEILGYGFLIVSIIWTIIVNLTAEMTSDSNLLQLNEKLNIIWSFEGDKKDYIENNDSHDLSQDYNQLHEHWNGPVFDDTLLKVQDKNVKYISYVLFALSTLFISAGRLYELFKGNPKKSNIRKYPKYKKRKRRNRMR